MKHFTPSGGRIDIRRHLRGNANNPPCVIGVTKAIWLVVRYKPRSPPILRRCSLACSSDQKNTDFRQKASMMLGSFSFSKSTSGMKISGSAPSATRYLS